MLQYACMFYYPTTCAENMKQNETKRKDKRTMGNEFYVASYYVQVYEIEYRGTHQVLY
jgi:hypothetical protein